ncbi:MAG: hypothetical protein CR982_04510 [Candidatus Cloacimonadota bacterium]|nr:MAG: hypothetical protein CR982_04510 [Candidatus Cloacimonadota bacterium]PIE80065.1 MAG: hypothetical protein CSA15_02270 [Candidatus Delongbacteria bacterium]
MKKLVSIFVPARDEEKNIVELINRIDSTIRKMCQFDFEMILVNDGSKDKTGEIADDMSINFPFLKVLHHRKGMGLTQAMKTGFAEVRGDYVLFLPADLECDPREDIPKLMDKMITDDLDVVTGWRQGRGDGKNFASAIYNTVSKKLFKVDVHDMNWIKGFKREVLEDLELRSDWHRFIVMMAAEKGYKIDEVKTNWYPRLSGSSKFGLMRFPIALVDSLVVKFNMVFGSKPMQFFSLFGVILMLLGVLGILFLTYYYLVKDTQIRPLFTLSTTLIIAGLQLFITGFLAELVVSQKDEISDLKKKIKDLKRR